MQEQRSLIDYTSQIELNDKEFNTFRKLIYEWAGIYMSDAKRALIAGRLLKRLRHYRLSSYGEYIDIVLHPDNKEEKQILINLLTTNETYFFREDQHLIYLRENILSAIHPTKTNRFRVWSAASSSGQEAYSISMILQDTIGADTWEILGTDISETVLEKARYGVYPIEAAEKIPKEYLKKYCLKGVRSQEGTFTVLDDLKKNISFQYMNLNEPFPSIGMFDVVFLRNVMIYFDRDTKAKLIEKIYHVLKNDGFLVLGHSENLNNLSNSFKSVAPTIYEKVM